MFYRLRLFLCVLICSLLFVNSQLVAETKNVRVETYRPVLKELRKLLNIILLDGIDSVEVAESVIHYSKKLHDLNNSSTSVDEIMMELRPARKAFEKKLKGHKKGSHPEESLKVLSHFFNYPIFFGLKGKSAFAEVSAGILLGVSLHGAIGVLKSAIGEKFVVVKPSLDILGGGGIGISGGVEKDHWKDNNILSIDGRLQRMIILFVIGAVLKKESYDAKEDFTGFGVGYGALLDFLEFSRPLSLMRKKFDYEQFFYFLLDHK